MKSQLKQPAEQLVYEFDFAADLGADVANVLSVHIVARGRVAQVAALQAVSSAIDGSKVRIALDGGTAGELYLVTVRVASAGGLAEAEQEFELLCEDLAWTVPDGAAPYLSIAEFVEAVGLDEAVRLTDEAGTGRIDKTRLIRAILDEQAFADGWLAGRYDVPLASAPPLIKVAVCDRVRARLWRRELPEDVKDARDQATATLKALSSGAMKLPATQEPAASPAPAAPVLFVGPGRTYPPGSLDSY